MTSNSQVLFTKVPTAYPQPGEHMQVVKSTIDLDAPLADGDYLVKTLVLSVDPYMRGRMRSAEVKSYSPAFELNKPMNGHVVGEVIKSNNPDFKVGDYVYGNGPFEEYTHVTAAAAKRFVVRNEARDSGIPVSYFVGALGMPGLTAYVGLYIIGQPKKGETIFISAASGAVGQIVGQLAKQSGLRVVGSAGSDDKVNYLKTIGFDAAFNYKTQDINQSLSQACPDGIDIYFENVGGETLEIVLTKMNVKGRVVGCGMISQYNTQSPYGVKTLMNLVGKRLRLEGFIVSDHPEAEPEFLEKVIPLIKEGKIKFQETISEGIETTPQALVDVLKGVNFGKQVVKVANL
ncbi:hypothetical protein INT43_004402 [Umbelopsis isabellina]|uniref:Enoyl reductase (ER) domain-containing protein n=1 Tax=Mortierella isabellina TaxID=91625 RepID=A0A8H7PIW6_MORIS|nr:hypothetical protein INT43_004402 [Umbelopsis isabellina]